MALVFPRYEPFLLHSYTLFYFSAFWHAYKRWRSGEGLWGYDILSESYDRTRLMVFDRFYTQISNEGMMTMLLVLLIFCLSHYDTFFRSAKAGLNPVNIRHRGSWKPIIILGLFMPGVWISVLILWDWQNWPHICIVCPRARVRNHPFLLLSKRGNGWKGWEEGQKISCSLQ